MSILSVQVLEAVSTSKIGLSASKKKSKYGSVLKSQEIFLNEKYLNNQKTRMRDLRKNISHFAKI